MSNIFIDIPILLEHQSQVIKNIFVDTVQKYLKEYSVVAGIHVSFGHAWATCAQMPHVDNLPMPIEPI
jgi:hypothetical protein